LQFEAVSKVPRREVKSSSIKMSINVDEAMRICAVYDWDMKGELDMYYFMDIFYALGFNIIKKVCVKYGQMEEPEKKYMKFDAVVDLMKKAIKEPENQGTYLDYCELCKLYDKNENGTIMLAELSNFLSCLGDTIEKEDTEKMLAELCDKEDEDGFIPYKPFLDRLCGKA